MSLRPRAASLVLAAASLAVALGTAPEPARADAVMPPPANCPPGHVGVTSHGGPQCVAVAPKNCPPAWHGLLGGTCTLTPCGDDSGCASGETCTEQSVCLEPFQDSYYEWNEVPTMSRGPGGNWLGAPPPAKRPRPYPITRYDAVNVCAPDFKCDAPRACQPEKICVPKGKHAAVFRGTNLTPARVARITDPGPPGGPAPSASAPPPDASAAPAPAPTPTPPAPSASDMPSPVTLPAAPPPSQGGCAGCSATSASTKSLAVVGLLAAGAAVIVARRRRAR